MVVPSPRAPLSSTTVLEIVALSLLGPFACTFGDFESDAGPEDAALIDGAVPIDVAVDPVDAGDARVDAGPDADRTDAGSHPIGPLGAGLSTLVGDGAAGFVNGTREFSLFNNPVNVIVGPNGNLYVTDFDNGLIREVTPAGVTTTLVNQAGFSRPFGMVFTPAGEFYVQTDRNSVGAATGAIWAVALDTGIATLELEDSGRVRGIANLSDGRLVLADTEAHVLSTYDPVTNLKVPLAGSAGVPGFAEGTGAAARFNRPWDILVTSTDLIYVADSENHRIRQVTLGGVVTTLAGSGAPGSTDGASLTASFNTPVGLALIDDTSMYVSEFDTGLIRQLSGEAVSTIAGSTRGFADNINPLLGQLNVCEGIDFADPYLYISDGNGGSGELYNRVRRLDTSE